MSESKDLNIRLSALEGKVRQLIAMHESLKASCSDLLAENHRLAVALEEERMRAVRLDEGYKNLKEQESAATRLQVDRINLRINELVSEIDKNIQLIEY